MVEALATKTGEALASQLGSELLRVSPFFSMYVSYCAHFMRANELLEQVLALPRTATYCHVLPRTATCCHVLPRTATHCHVLPRTATYCHVLSRTITHCHVLSRTVTYPVICHVP